MLLALGPLLLDTAVRTVVVALVDGSGAASVEQAAAGADALWLPGAGTPDEVAAACRTTGLPVGVTADDLAELDELVAAGAVAVECGAEGAVELAAASCLTMWCTPRQADAALAAGVPATQVVVEGDGTGLRGVTVDGHGPAAWGEVVAAVLGGVRMVRTEDARAVRRVVTVTNRLLAARVGTGQAATT